MSNKKIPLSAVKTCSLKHLNDSNRLNDMNPRLAVFFVFFAFLRLRSGQVFAVKLSEDALIDHRSARTDLMNPL